MTIFLMTSQIIVSVILIISVILQDTKNAPISNTSDSQAYFKPKGKDAFLNRVTTISAILLFVISISNLFVK